MRRIGGAKDKISFDMVSERNVEVIGSGTKSKSNKLGSGSKNKKGSGSRRLSVKDSRQAEYLSRISYYPSKDRHAREELFRLDRKLTVEMFNSYYVYGAVNSNDQSSSCDPRTLICSGGSESWPVASSGITWVAVNGEDSICVVTKKKQHLDKARLIDFLRLRPKKHILSHFMGTIVHEMDDPSSELRQRFKQGAMIRSFAALSVALGIDGVHQGGSHDGSNEGSFEAIKFLKEKLENDPVFTYEETIDTAISALEHLYRENFRAGDILVDVLVKGKQYDKLLPTKEVRARLAVIRKSANGLEAGASCCSKKLKRSVEDKCATVMEVDEHS